MDDVVITDLPQNVSAPNRRNDRTRLKSVKGVETESIDVSSLRHFCSAVGLKGMQKVKKLDICNKISESKASGSYRVLQQQRAEEETEKEN